MPIIWISAFTWSTTVTVFAPGCLVTRRNTDRSPSTRTIAVCVSFESATVPTSFTWMGTPVAPVFLTTMSSIGATSLNWLFV
jgi:hypothetical protein